MQVHLSLCWAHMQSCRKYCVPAHIFFSSDCQLYIHPVLHGGAGSLAGVYGLEKISVSSFPHVGPYYCGIVMCEYHCVLTWPLWKG